MSGRKVETVNYKQLDGTKRTFYRVVDSTGQAIKPRNPNTDEMASDYTFRSEAAALAFATQVQQ